MTTSTSTIASNQTESLSTTNDVLVCTDLGKHYIEGEQQLTILENVALRIAPAERIAIVGASGSGKTTLLNLLGGLDQPSTGDVTILGQSLLSLNDQDLSDMRNNTLGFVYQFHHLLPEFTALENVLMPLMIARKNKQQSIQRATELLDSVGLSKRVQHRPSALSGGER
ncbi:MAG: ATP-binding cassette domain-containing protein, partial [Cellvibrionales bacterium]|nr:ATP-binding cassette domain-containing protein [Cellvibrionales bacterium]